MTAGAGRRGFGDWRSFWLATSIERMKNMALPVLTIFIPLIKIIPALYARQIERRLQQGYGRLNDVAVRISAASAGCDVASMQAELEAIENGAVAVPVSFSYAEQFYNLTSHIEMVRQRLVPA